MSEKEKNQGSQPEKKRRGFRLFALGMAVYAAAFLLITAGGLYLFWQYIESFENSRAKHTVNAYMQALSAEHICDLSRDVIDSIDHNLESEQECRAFLVSELGMDFTCAKRNAECTDRRQVYSVRCGGQPVGQFSITTTQADRFGFTPWVLEDEAYDLSYMIGQAESITVPDVLCVCVNGKTLDSSYITEDQVPYEALECYAEAYELPHQVTYSYGPFLGELGVSVQDAEGNEVDLTEETDRSPYFHNCTPEETEELDAVTERFIRRYVAFTGCANRASMDNYYNLMRCMVPDSDFTDRMVNALDGLQYAQSKGDDIASLTTHHQVRLEEGRYVCDVSYELDTTGHNGVVRTQTNAKLMLVRSGSELLVETMEIY